MKGIPRRIGTLLALTGMLGLAGCGLFQASSPPVPHRHPKPVAPLHHRHHPSQKPGATRHAKPTPTPPPSSKPGQPPTGQGGYVAPPPPPNVGSYQDLEAQVLAVTPLGTARDSGRPLTLYGVKLAIYNPTPAIIRLALNDLTVVPVGGPDQYAWNDYNTTDLTASDSLFWPVTDPANPSSTFVIIDAGSRLTGLVNVEVPAAAHYDVVWGAPNSGQVAATFAP
jgi:hypothetical protein